MKISCYSFMLLFMFISCFKKTASDSNIPESKKPDTTLTVQNENSAIPKSTENDWQSGFNLTHNIDIDSINKKPVRFYIENKNCNKKAIDFYYGEYRPSDDKIISDLLALSYTNNIELRPFYRWILDKTIEISDGALAEYPGIPARKYAEKFPDEFFKFIDSDSTKERYSKWVDIISYSGFYDEDDYKNPSIIRKHLISIMIKNSSEKLKKRITQFAFDSFPNVNKTDL